MGISVASRIPYLANQLRENSIEYINSFYCRDFVILSELPNNNPMARFSEEYSLVL
jgi:hypothetical protein